MTNPAEDGPETMLIPFFRVFPEGDSLDWQNMNDIKRSLLFAILEMRGLKNALHKIFYGVDFSKIVSSPTQY